MCGILLGIGTGGVRMDVLESLFPLENAYRKCKSLDGVWHVSLASEGNTRVNEQNRHFDMIVPADITALDRSPMINTYSGDILYERNFFAPKEWMGQEVYLRFEGVSSVFSVAINGRYAAFHKAKDSLQIIDVTRYLNYGEQNKIIVKIENQKANTAKGILKSIYLYTIPQARIVDYSLGEIELLDNALEFNYEIELNGNCLATVTLRDEDGIVVSTGVGHRGRIRLENPKLWDFDQNYIYRIDFEVSRLGKQCDAYSIKLPFYKLAILEDSVLLNNREITLNLKQIAQADIQTLWHAKKTFLELKMLGFNAVVFNESVADEIWNMAQKDGLLVLENKKEQSKNI